MARTVRDAKLETRAARGRLSLGEHFRTLVPGRLHLGYIKRRKDAPGRWFLRWHLGDAAEGKANPYRKATIGLSDDYRDADGIDVFSFAEAQRLAHEKYEAPRREARRVVTVADVMDRYVDSLAARSPRTIRGARGRAQLHILPTLGQLPAGALALETLNRWKIDLALSKPRVGRTKAGATPKLRAQPDATAALKARKSTANKIISELKAALMLAEEEARIPEHGAWKRLKKFPADEITRSRASFYEVGEAARLVAASDEASGFRNLVRAALETGCRFGELAGLRVGDVQGGQVYIRHSKSGKDRYVQLTDDGEEFFAALAADRPADETLLLRNGEREWRQSEQQRPMAAACKAAGIRALNFHQLRHTWASLALKNDLPLIMVAHNLGHRDTSMVERHYGHIKREDFERKVRERAPRYGFGGNVVPLHRSEAA